MYFSDVFDWCMRYIVGPVFLVLLVGFCLLLIVGLFCIPSCIMQEKEQEQHIEFCYKQKPRTEDCEYVLWKYELEKKQPRHTTTAVPVVMPVVR